MDKELMDKALKALQNIETDVTEMLETLRAVKGINYGLALNALFNQHVALSVLAMMSSVKPREDGSHPMDDIIIKTCRHQVQVFSVMMVPQPKTPEGKDIEFAPKLVQDHIDAKRAKLMNEMIDDLAVLMSKQQSHAKDIKV